MVLPKILCFFLILGQFIYASQGSKGKKVDKAAKVHEAGHFPGDDNFDNYNSNRQSPFFGSLTCTCGVLGPDDNVKLALRNWAKSYYTRSNGYNGDSNYPFGDDHRFSSGHVSTCVAPACYRADFIGVTSSNGYDQQQGRHYTVLGCSEPGSLGHSAFEYKMHENATLREFLPNHYSGHGPTFVRHAFELLCTHEKCRNMAHEQWHPYQYQWKTHECVSQGSKLYRGAANLVITIFCILLAQRQF